MRILGVDYGLKKAGLAFAETGLAEPLAVIYNKALAEKILRLCRDLEIEKVVIGLPEGPLAQKVRELKLALESQGIKVDYQDETLTSRDAIDKMVAAGKKKKFRREKQDSVAAALILQAYLDKVNPGHV